MTLTEGKPSVARSVTITGTRSISHIPAVSLAGAFGEYLQPFAVPDAHFYLGGAAGIDTAALEWMAEHTPVVLTVVVPCTVADQPASAGEAIMRWSRCGRLAEIVELGAPELGTPAYHARNRWMVDRSGLVIGFPRGSELTSGTWYTMNYAAEQSTPHLVVPI